MPAVVPGYRKNDFTRTTPYEFLMQTAPLQRAEHTVRAVPAEGAHRAPAATRSSRAVPAGAAAHLVARPHRDALPISITQAPRYELSGEF